MAKTVTATTPKAPSTKTVGVSMQNASIVVNEAKYQQVKISVSANAAIDGNTLRQRFVAAGLQEPTLKNRSENDAIRASLDAMLARTGNLTLVDPKEGRQISGRLVKCPAKSKGQGDLRIDVHIRKKGSKVNYGHVGAILNNEKNPASAVWEPTDEDPHLLNALSTDIMNVLQNPESLIEYGQRMVFDTDISDIVEEIFLGAGLASFWRGQYMAFSEKQNDLIDTLQAIFAGLDMGQVKIARLTVLADQSSKETIKDELLAQYQKQLDYLIEQLEEEPSERQLNTIQAKFQELRDRSSMAQSQMGIQFGDEWAEAQSDFYADMTKHFGGVQTKAKKGK